MAKHLGIITDWLEQQRMERESLNSPRLDYNPVVKGKLGQVDKRGEGFFFGGLLPWYRGGTYRRRGRPRGAPRRLIQETRRRGLE